MSQDANRNEGTLQRVFANYLPCPECPVPCELSRERDGTMNSARKTSTVPVFTSPELDEDDAADAKRLAISQSRQLQDDVHLPFAYRTDAMIFTSDQCFARSLYAPHHSATV